MYILCFGVNYFGTTLLNGVLYKTYDDDDDDNNNNTNDDNNNNRRERRLTVSGNWLVAIFSLENTFLV